ncbi:MAG: SET domain-containing protein [Hyphomonadaceae bacterium]|nr:SET domain-containing protein [Hyphomonadaceae bacterium]
MASKYTPGDYDLSVKRSYAGLGLFTNSAIERGKCVVEYYGRELTEEEERTSRSKYLFEVSATKTIDGTERDNVARYINHSCRPNCEAVIAKGRVFIFARRGIKPGEELTYDYGKNYFNTFIKPNGCRCDKCMPKDAGASR